MTGIAYADRREWLEARRQGIGGSDAAAIIGVSPWRTALDVWLDKVGVSEEQPASPAMKWGTRLEDVVAAALTEERGIPIRRVRRILVHPTLPHVIGSVDRLSGRDTVVEIKTARRADDWPTEEEAKDLPPEQRVPPQYYIQGQHYAGITGRSRILFGVLIGGSDLRAIEVPADQGFIADLFDEEERFWTEYVEPGIRPPLSWADQPYVARLFPYGDGEKVATPEVDVLVAELLKVRDQEDAANRHRRELEIGIQQYLAESKRLVSGVTKVTWGTTTTRAVKWDEIAGGLRSAIETLRDENPGLVDAALSSGFGTTDLDQVEQLFTTTTTRRGPFLVDRKGASR